MNWFQTLTGIEEQSPEHVRRYLGIEGTRLISRASGRSYQCGLLETPSLQELRKRIATDGEPETGAAGPRLRLREVVADVQQLHLEPDNEGAVFQVASQFNLLEMVSPEVTPEQGVAGYQYDRTQGPACAIAAAAGTIQRNYFVAIDGKPGQTAERQIDCLADLGNALGNQDQRLWSMRNGYALATREGLAEITRILAETGEAGRERLRQLLRVGVQRDTEVTLRASSDPAFTGQGPLVTQVYASALPVAYSPHPADQWQAFARLVLEAAYEATLAAAIENARRTGNAGVYLTLLGGGAFGNRSEWILDAIKRAIGLFRHEDLDVAIVSYGGSNPDVRALVG